MNPLKHLTNLIRPIKNPLSNIHGFSMLSIALSIVLLPTMVLVATQQYSMSQRTAALQHSTSTKNNFVTIKNYIISTANDIDGDTKTELLKEGVGNTLPASVPVRATDDWGGAIKYYTWDLAAANTNATYSQNNVAPPVATLIGRIISAGRDGVFQTTSASTASQGDDIAFDILTTDTVSNSDNSGWKEDAANNKVTLKTPGRSVEIGNNLNASGSTTNYGSMSINGSKNGWSGVGFPGSGTLMMRSDYSGFYNKNDSDWRFLVSDVGTMYGPGGGNIKLGTGITFPNGTVQTTAAGGMSGYQIVTSSVASSGHYSVDVYCPVGKVVIGGGCNQQAGTYRVTHDTNPIGSTGWHCGVGVAVANQSVVTTAYAICANP